MYRRRRLYISLLVILCCLSAGCAPVSPPASSSSESASETNDGLVAELAPAPFESDEDDEAGSAACPIAGNGTGFTSRGGTSDINGQLHGPLVLATVANTLSEMGGMLVPFYDDDGILPAPVAILILDEFSRPDERRAPIRVHRMRLIQPGDEIGDILVAEVDIQNFNVAQITEAIGSAILTLSNIEGLPAESQPRDFVLNMSWMILPCDKIPGTVEEYLTQVCNGPDEAVAELESIKTKLDELVGTGVVSDLCNQALPMDIVTLVGELMQDSHNLRYLWLSNLYLSLEQQASQLLLYEFFDCLVVWNADFSICDDLLEVGILTDENRTPPSPSPSPEKRQYIPVAASGNTTFTVPIPYPFEPALWDSVVSVSAFDNIDYLPNDGEIAMPGRFPFPPAPQPHLYEGTSFAAPRFSVWAAAYLLNGGLSPCLAAPNITPVLGYKGPSLSTEQYHNFRIIDGADQHCSPFWELINAWVTFQPSLNP